MKHMKGVSEGIKLGGPDGMRGKGRGGSVQDGPLTRNICRFKCSSGVYRI